MNKLAAADKHKPLGKYTILTTIAQKYTTNVGYPGYANAAIGDIFNQSLIPQMFAQVAQGKMTAEDAARSIPGAVQDDLREVEGAGAAVDAASG